MRSSATAFLLALALAACGEPARDAQAPETPIYEAIQLDGEEVSLAGLRGDAVLLNVWATWCAPCRQEIPYLAELHKSEAAKGLRVIGVSIDAARDQDAVARTAPELGITYDVWLDPDERIASIMRYAGVPATMLLDRDGAVRWKHVGILRPTTPGFAEALRDVLEPAASS